jgi:hypothetical protein
MAIAIENLDQFINAGCPRYQHLASTRRQVTLDSGATLPSLYRAMPRPPVSGVPPTPIERHIHLIRGQKVMLDADLAALYGVTTSALNQAVRRNVERFPEDFAFQLSKGEFDNWRSQIVISNPAAKMGLRHRPYAFTQEGVAMLSSVLRSDRAIKMNVLIMRTFVRLREMIAANKDLAARIEKLETGQKQTSSIIDVLVDEIDRIAREVKTMKTLPTPPRRKIGFKL